MGGADRLWIDVDAARLPADLGSFREDRPGPTARVEQDPGRFASQPDHGGGDGRAKGAGAYRVDPVKARQAASNYLAQAGYPGQVRLGRDAIGDRVDVALTWSQQALFARFVGVGRYRGTVQASAHVCHGVVQEEGC